MKRQFLNTGEIAIFRADEGECSFTAQGPCSTAWDAYQRATKGYDADHTWQVLRLDLEGRIFEDVTDECGDELAWIFASQDLPQAAAPAFVDRSEIETFTKGMRRDWKRMRQQGVA